MVILIFRDTLTAAVTLGIVVLGNVACRAMLRWGDPTKEEFPQIPKYLHHFEQGIYALALCGLGFMLVVHIVHVVRENKHSDNQ